MKRDRRKSCIFRTSGGGVCAHFGKKRAEKSTWKKVKLWKHRSNVVVVVVFDCGHFTCALLNVVRWGPVQFACIFIFSLSISLAFAGTLDSLEIYLNDKSFFIFSLTFFSLDFANCNSTNVKQAASERDEKYCTTWTINDVFFLLHFSLIPIHFDRIFE